MHLNTEEIRITGRVLAGEKVGRTIGFPTANLSSLPDENKVKTGVYSAICVVKNSSHKCLAYFGPRLVFNELKNVFEVYILDFNQDIYQESVSVVLGDYLRPPVKVASLQELKELLKNDVRKVKQSYARTP